MAIAQGNNITASDMTTWLTSINTTLTKYGVATESNTFTQGSSAAAAKINAIVTKLLTCDANSKHTTPNDQQTTLNNNKVTAGQLIYASTINNIKTSSDHLNSHYCSCNCNFCSCDCDFCSCDCRFCSCNSNCYTHYCSISSEHVCFLPGTIIFTTTGPKPIEEIVAGDYVLTAKGEFDQVLTIWSAEVTNTPIKTYVGDSFEISLTSHHLIPMDEQYNISYPQLYESNDKIILKNQQYYPKELLKNLIYLIPALKQVNNYSCKFKKLPNIINICQSIITSDFDYNIIDDEIIIFGNLHDFPFSQYLKPCLNSHNIFIFPSWIYTLPKEYIEYYKEAVDNGLKFNNIEQCLQMKLIFNSYGWDYKRDYNKLIFIKNLNKPTKNNIIEIKDDIYSGEVYNLQCKNSRFIASEIIVGDGYV